MSSDAARPQAHNGGGRGTSPGGRRWKWDGEHMDKAENGRMTTAEDGRPTPPRAVDLRRARRPEVEISDGAAFDFLLSVHVCVASPEQDYTDYDVGREWIAQARGRCAEADPHALGLLDRCFGGAVPGSLHATLLSLVALAPKPRDVEDFLGLLETAPIEQVLETLLDQEGLDDDWRADLHAALDQQQGKREAHAARERLAARYGEEVGPTLLALLEDPESTRRDLLAALRVWDAAVFAPERARVLPLIRREAELLAHQRTEMPPERFVQMAMRGVEWQRPASLRKIVFAPSYFARPAVYYHFWHGTLTFCLPVEATILEEEQRQADPRAPGEEILRYFETLGDSTRLRILRLLCEREMYLTELAEKLGLTKATTKHHMVRLRANGFVTLYDRDRMTFYALRPGIARQAARLIEEYLQRAP
jgi:DNA-binding transcriptional ArsR family regulator